VNRRTATSTGEARFRVKGAHLLVTGGAGFIGSAFVRDVLARRDGTRITVLDRLTYAGNEANLAPIRDDPEAAARFRFVRGDICDATAVGPLVAEADAVVNFAAESHVDRSILDSEAFLRTGILGVHVLLEAVRGEADRAAAGERSRPPRFLQVSTDEVYGSIAEGHARETDPVAPRSPYSAAKAAGAFAVSVQGSFHQAAIAVAGGWAGTRIVSPHFLHVAFRPASCSGAATLAPQAGHAKRIMGLLSWAEGSTRGA